MVLSAVQRSKTFMHCIIRISDGSLYYTFSCVHYDVDCSHLRDQDVLVTVDYMILLRG